MARRALALLVLMPLLLAAAPQPSGTLTRVGTGLPITYTITFDHVGRRDHIWVSTSCWDPATGERVYYGEDFNPYNRLGPYVMDDTAWQLWTPVGQNPAPGDSCRTFLIFSDERTPTQEIVLDDSGFFTVP